MKNKLGTIHYKIPGEGYFSVERFSDIEAMEKENLALFLGKNDGKTEDGNVYSYRYMVDPGFHVEISSERNVIVKGDISKKHKLLPNLERLVGRKLKQESIRLGR